MDRITTNTYNEAVAWIPQSSVAILINKVWNKVVGVPEFDIPAEVPGVDILLQVHDSLVGQFDIDKPYLLDQVLEVAKIPLPYADPLVIPMGAKVSDKSWGECG